MFNKCNIRLTQFVRLFDYFLIFLNLTPNDLQFIIEQRKCKGYL